MPRRRGAEVIRPLLDTLPGFDLPNSPPWMEDAICAQTDPESFFPEKGGSTREAKAICRRCTVAAECLDYALENEERFGIWGGLSERERRKITRLLHPNSFPIQTDQEEEPA